MRTHRPLLCDLHSSYHGATSVRHEVILKVVRTSALQCLRFGKGRYRTNQKLNGKCFHVRTPGFSVLFTANPHIFSAPESDFSRWTREDFSAEPHIYEHFSVLASCPIQVGKVFVRCHSTVISDPHSTGVCQCTTQLTPAKISACRGEAD